jgi:hypothetical protein
VKVTEAGIREHGDDNETEEERRTYRLRIQPTAAPPAKAQCHNGVHVQDTSVATGNHALDPHGKVDRGGALVLPLGFLDVELIGGEGGVERAGKARGRFVRVCAMHMSAIEEGGMDAPSATVTHNDAAAPARQQRLWQSQMLSGVVLDLSKALSRHGISE